MSSYEKMCFVIAPIGPPESEIRKVSDKVLKYIIKPAVEECGYTAIRADEIAKPGMINTDMINMIIECPLVIANLSGHNPNVFYELGIRHAIGKPVIQMIHKGELLPFDVSQARTIEYTLEVDGAENARQKITIQIRAIENNSGDFDNPVTTTFEIQSLRNSEDPIAKSNAEILENLGNIQAQLENNQRTNRMLLTLFTAILNGSSNAKTTLDFSQSLSYPATLTSSVLKNFYVKQDLLNNDFLPTMYKILQLYQENIDREEDEKDEPED